MVHLAQCQAEQVRVPSQAAGHLKNPAPPFLDLSHHLKPLTQVDYLTLFPQRVPLFDITPTPQEISYLLKNNNEKQKTNKKN